MIVARTDQGSLFTLFYRMFIAINEGFAAVYESSFCVHHSPINIPAPDDLFISHKGFHFVKYFEE